MKKIEVVAKTVEGAIEKGLTELGLTRDRADIKVISEGGFLKQSKVIISQKKTLADTAAEFAEGLLEKMNITCVVEAEEDEEEIKLELIGTDTSGIIGYRGEVLDALQYIVSIAVNKNKEDFKRVVIDTEDYRAKRISALEQLAKNLESKVIRTKRSVKLEPMNSFERRIIHSALQNSAEVTTASEGNSPSRYVVIFPKNSAKKPDRAKHQAERKDSEEKEEKNSAPSGKKQLNFVYRSDKKKRR